jgi:hypothetical protein
MTLPLFLDLYGLALLGGLLVAVTAITPMVAQRLVSEVPAATLVGRKPDEQQWRDDPETGAAPAEAGGLRRSA